MAHTESWHHVKPANQTMADVKWSINMVCLACLLSVPGRAVAIASEDDTFKPYAYSGMVYDSNLLRLSNSVNPLLTTGKKDTSEIITQVAAGFDMDWKYNRQHLLIKANANQNWFENFSSLNYLGWDNTAMWNWQAGNDWNGDIGYNNKESLGVFSNLNGLIANLSNFQRYFASGGYMFHPNGLIKLGIFRNEFQYGDPSRTNSNSVEDNAELNLQYLSPLGGKVGLRVTGANGSYPNRVFTPTSTVDNAYTRLNYMLTWDWQYDTKLRLFGDAGFVQQQYEHLRVRDYSSMTAHLGLQWLLSEKTLLKMTLKREIAQSSNINASFYQIQGVEINPTWYVTPKIALMLPLSYLEQLYLGETGFINTTGLPQQTNNTGSIGLNLKYEMLSNVIINSILSYEKRDSNIAFRSYESSSAGVNVQVNF